MKKLFLMKNACVFFAIKSIISLMKKNIFLMKKYACVFFVIKEGVLNEPIFHNEEGEK